MMLLRGCDAAVAAWVGGQIGVPSFGPSVAIGVVAANGDLLGGVVFHDYRPAYSSVEVSCAASTQRWLTKPVIAEIMAYPFQQLNCQRVTAITPKRNRPCRLFLEAFGFKREGLVRKGFGGDDAVIYGLLQREWLASPWARPKGVKGGQILRDAAAAA